MVDAPPRPISSSRRYRSATTPPAGRGGGGGGTTGKLPLPPAHRGPTPHANPPPPRLPAVRRHLPQLPHRARAGLLPGDAVRHRGAGRVQRFPAEHHLPVHESTVEPEH